MRTPTPMLFTHFGDNWLRGSERCLLDLLTHLDRDSFQPVVWCNSPLMAEAVKALSVPVVQSRFPVLLGWQAPRFDVRGYRQLLAEGQQLIEQYQIELLHANSAAPCQWLVPLARRNGIPVLAHLHARYLLRDRLSLRLHGVDLAVGVSQPVVEGLLADGLPDYRVTVVPNGIDVARLEAQAPSALRERFGIPAQAPLLAAVGSLIARKGIDLLLHALHRVHEAGFAAHLVVIGEGPERANLERLSDRLGLNQCVHFVGECSEPAGLLRSGVDMLVSGAREEVFGLVLAEGGCMGLPVVAPRVGGIAEVIEHGKTGVLVAPNSAQTLAEGILTLLQHPERAKAMGEAGRLRVHKRFTAQANAHAIQDCYRRLLLGGHARERATSGLLTRWLMRSLRQRLTGHVLADQWL